MIDSSIQELISGYLDGELTADEQKRIRALLESDAEARVFYEELVGLRGSLALLPRHACPPDMASRVLKEAERSLLIPPSSPTVSELPSATTRASVPVKTSRAERTWRTIALASLTLAAGLLVVIVLREPADQSLLARQEKTSQGTVSSTETPAEAQNTVPMLAPPVVPDTAFRAADAPLPKKENQLDDSPLHSARPSAARSSAPLPIQPAEPSDFSQQRGVRGEGKKKAADDLGQQAGVRPFSAPAPGLGLDRGQVVVQVDITRTALEEEAFDKLLERQGIAVRDQAPADAIKKSQAGKQGGDRPPELEKQRKREVDASLEMVYLEAAPAQVAGVLAELAARRAEFPDVAFAAPGSPNAFPSLTERSKPGSRDLAGEGVTRHKNKDAEAKQSGGKDSAPADSNDVQDADEASQKRDAPTPAGAAWAERYWLPMKPSATPTRDSSAPSKNKTLENQLLPRAVGVLFVFRVLDDPQP